MVRARLVAAEREVNDARRQDSLGLLLMVASAGCFAAMAPLTRKWLVAIEPQSIVLARAIVMVVVFAAWGAARGVDLRGRDRVGLVTRGVVGWLAISCYVWSTQHLPSGQAVLLQYSHPVFVAALAPALLKERPGPLHWPLVLAGFGGLAVAVGVGGKVERAALIGLTGALLSGIAYMTVRRIAATEPPLTIIFWFAAVMLPCSAIGAAVPGSLLDSFLAASGGPGDATAPAGAASTAALSLPPRHVLPDSLPEWLAYGGVVVAGLLGQVVLTEGLARAGAARAVAVTMAGPLFGLLFDLLFFARAPSALALAGTLVVVAALALLGWLKPPAALTEGEAE
jgi:drug/metabolite transporter (DMT)-like permease